MLQLLEMPSPIQPMVFVLKRSMAQQMPQLLTLILKVCLPPAGRPYLLFELTGNPFFIIDNMASGIKQYGIMVEQDYGESPL